MKETKRESKVTYLIIEATTNIRTIYRGDKSEVLPIFPLKIFIVQVARCTVPVEKNHITFGTVKWPSVYPYTKNLSTYQKKFITFFSNIALALLNHSCYSIYNQMWN